MPNPIDDSLLYDLILLAGVPSPGLAEISGASAPREFDIRKGYGISGATTVYTGDTVSKFTVKLKFFNPVDIDRYQEDFAPLLEKPPAGTKPKALDFYHGFASEPPLNIKSVLVEDVSQLKQDADGYWSVDIKMIQARPPKAAIGKPSGSNGNSTNNDAKDAADKEIETNTKTIKELQNG